MLQVPGRIIDTSVLRVISQVICIRSPLNLIQVCRVSRACLSSSFLFPNIPNSAWTSHYSGQSEIQAYLSHVARKYDLYKKTRFETEVIKTEWDDHRKQWLVEWRSVVNHQVTGEGYYDFV